MRHRNKTVKLGRKHSHRDAMFANMVSSLIMNKRITTTLPKAKAARSIAEKMVTFGKAGTLAARRLVIARLQAHGPGSAISKDKKLNAGWHKTHDVVRILFEEIAPAMKDRNGGYTRIYKLGRRSSDGAERAILEWVTFVPQQPVAVEPEEKKGKASRGKKAASAGAESKDDKKE
jgi:large subunit ribosomal protein L17